MNHVSLDLETMGNTPSAAIVQIGAYAIHGVEDAADPERSLRINVDLDDCIRHGLTVDGSTVYWWLAQSSHARSSLIDPAPILLAHALTRFNDWLKLVSDSVPNTQIWSHAAFDGAILLGAYHAAGIEPLIGHRQMVDLRTLRHFPDHDRVDLKRGSSQEHAAEHDAWAQGQDVVRALQAAGHS